MRHWDPEVGLSRLAVQSKKRRYLRRSGGRISSLDPDQREGTRDPFPAERTGIESSIPEYTVQQRQEPKDNVDFQRVIEEAT